jgi:RNA polymerase sigma-70 factor (sigma-E family)
MELGADRDDDFTAFVTARSARLVHIAHMLCGDAGLAEDMAQTALEKAYVKWDRIRLTDPFAYVRQTIVSEHRMVSRRRLWRERPSGSAVEVDTALERTSCANLSDTSTAVHHKVVLMAALGTLTRRERAVIVLRYVEDLTEVDTARVLGIAVGTVKSTAARALPKLRRSLELIDITVGGRP